MREKRRPFAGFSLSLLFDPVKFTKIFRLWTNVSFSTTNTTSRAALPEADRRLVAEAEAATAGAHAPYSRFRVGAAARLRSGRILRAANFEARFTLRGSVPSVRCSFTSKPTMPMTRLRRWPSLPDPSGRECYPCGRCRQVLVDVERRQGSPLRVVMSGGGTAFGRGFGGDAAAFHLQTLIHVHTRRHSLRRQPPACGQ